MKFKITAPNKRDDGKYPCGAGAGVGVGVGVGYMGAYHTHEYVTIQGRNLSSIFVRKRV